MRFDIPNARKRDNLITATLGDEVQSAFGNISQIANTNNTIIFFGSVMDKKSTRIVDEGKRRNVVMKSIMCDTRDVTALTIEHRITIDNDPTQYILLDVVQTEFKYTSELIIKKTS